MKQKIKIIGLLSALAVSSAQAEIAFNGFANIVAGTTTSSDETLYGYDDTFGFKQGSLFALQATSDLGDGLGVTAQILARGSEDWNPDFEWAYVSYDVTDELRFLAGRQRIPFYIFSDFLDVSYAYAWITPPEGVYSVPFDTFDGISMIYNHSLGEFDSTLHLTYGRNTDVLELLGNEVEDPDFSDMFTVAFTVNRDWLTLRTAYFQTEMVIPSDIPLYGAWMNAGFESVANNFIVEEDTGKFIEFGFQVDYEGFIIIGEYTQIMLDDTFLPDQDSYFIFFGKQFDDILIHATYGVDDNVKDSFTTGVPSGVSPELDGLIAATNSYTNGQAAEEFYYTLGLRWDFHESAALKFEYTSFSDDLNSNNDAGLFRTAIVTVF